VDATKKELKGIGDTAPLQIVPAILDATQKNIEG
jgi:hypothetical protein